MEAVRNRLKKNHSAQEVQFKTDDGVLISGILVLRQDAQRNLILCHGYMGSKEQMEVFVDMFSQDNILLFDFRAHGKSGGNFITVGYCEKDDVSAAVRFLKNNVRTKNLPVCGLGVSMGAASLICAASEGVPFDALILDSSFARLQDHVGDSFSMRTGLPRFPFLSIMSCLFRWMSGISMDDVNPCDRIERVACPVFVIHSEGDKIITVEHAHEIYKRAGKKKRLWIAQSKRHGYACSDCRESYFRQAHDFLDAAVA